MSKEKKGESGEDFPGYPHYPAKEDLLNQPNQERVDLDVENLSRSHKQTSSTPPDKSVQTPAADEPRPDIGDMDDDQPVPESEADVTKDDLIALGEEEVDFGRREKIGVTGDDLDVPGAEDDDENEEIGEEDEENNYYSLGGDAHENLEEDQS